MCSRSVLPTSVFFLCKLDPRLPAISGSKADTAGTSTSKTAHVTIVTTKSNQLAETGDTSALITAAVATLGIAALAIVAPLNRRTEVQRK